MEVVLDDVEHDFELTEEKDAMTVRFQAREELVEEDEFSGRIHQRVDVVRVGFL